MKPLNESDFVIVQFSREGDGLSSFGTVAARLGRAWDAAGIRNIFITPEPGTSGQLPRDTRTIAKWLKNIPVRGLSKLRYAGRVIALPIYALAAAFAARKHKSAVILSHGETMSGDVLVVHLLNRGYLDAKRKAGEWHWRLNPANLINSWINYRMISQRRYRRIVALSGRVAAEIEHYHGYPKDRIAIISNGVDNQKFAFNAASRDEIRARHSIAPHENILLLVGIPFRAKGVAQAIDALQRLDADTRLLVLGADDTEPYRKQWKGDPDRLLFLGFRNEIEKYYSAADILVVASCYESCTMVGLEALAAGLPLVATRVGGIEDYLVDGVNGFFTERNGADIAAKCRVILSHPALRQSMRQNAVATAANYSWDTVAMNYRNLLLDVWREKNGVEYTPVLLPKLREISNQHAHN